MEYDLIFFENGRRPHFFAKWKMTSIFYKMEDDLNLLKMEDGHNFFKWKMT